MEGMEDSQSPILKNLNLVTTFTRKIYQNKFGFILSKTQK